MKSCKTILAATTALTLLPASAVLAQAADQACTDLQQTIAQLPDPLPEGMDMTRDDLSAVVQENDAQKCQTTIQMVRTQTTTSTDQQNAATDQEKVVDQQQTTVTLQDQKVVRGVVYLDRTAPNIDVQEGQAEVMVTPAQPNVTVTEGQADIVIREQPATITLDMPQPTIRIEQPAPEIIITMPEPGVEVGNAQPTVEVRQSEPKVTVSQAAPKVDLELEVVEEGQEGGFQINDRLSGQTYAQGEAGQAMPVEQAQVKVTKSDPTVTLQKASQEPNIQVSRSEPTVRFENADPQVKVTQSGEPKVEFTRAGEPKVTFQQAQSGQGNQPATDQAAAGQSGSNQPQQMADTSATAPAQTDAAAASNETANAAQPADTTAQPADTMAQPADTTPPAADTMAQPADTTPPAGGDAALTPAPATDMAAVGNTATNPMVDPNRPAAPTGYTYAAAEELTADRLNGATLYGPNDERIGEVGEAIITPDGQITQLVVEVGGFLGIGEHDVALDFDRLQIVRSDVGGELRAYSNMTKEELEALPEYEN